MARPSPSFLPATCFVSKLFFCLHSFKIKRKNSFSSHPSAPSFLWDWRGGWKTEWASGIRTIVRAEVSEIPLAFLLANNVTIYTTFTAYSFNFFTMSYLNYSTYINFVHVREWHSSQSRAPISADPPAAWADPTLQDEFGNAPSPIYRYTPPLPSFFFAVDGNAKPPPPTQRATRTVFCRLDGKRKLVNQGP